MLSPLLFLLLPTFSNAIEFSPFGFSILSNNCTFKETLLPTAVCSRYIHQLSAYYSQGVQTGFSIDFLRNVSGLCNDMKSCFGRSQCEGVQRVGKIYEERCDQVEMNFYSMTSCLKSYYDQRDYGNVSCLLGYEIEFRNASTIKIPIGKDCLRSFASSSCFGKSVDYIDKYYEKLLNYLTVDSDGPTRCDSLHDKLEAYQCVSELNRFSEATQEFKTSKEVGKSYERNEGYFTPLYDSLKKCMSQYCFFTDEMKFYMEQLHDEMVTYSKTKKYQKLLERPSSFDSCLETILVIDVSDYYCVHRMFKKSASQQLEIPSVKLSRFLKDKECVKTVMKKECRLADFNTFDAEWEKLQMDMRDTKKTLTGY